MVNLSYRFANLSNSFNGFYLLQSDFANLSLKFWSDESKLTETVDKLSSVSTVAWNSWNYILNNETGKSLTNLSSTFYSVSLSNLSSTAWSTRQQVANLSQSFYNASNILNTTNISLANTSVLLGKTCLLYTSDAADE